MAPRAGIYTRISRVRVNSHEETLGVERQLPPCLELASRRGWEVDPRPAAEGGTLYVDNDLSAFTGARRPGYERMLEDARAGVLDVIVAWDADRLTRRPVENEALIDLAERHGIKLATATGEHDLATPSGRLHFRMLGSIARYESEHKAQRLQLKHEELARDGKPHGGQRAFGFAVNGVDHEPAEADAIREAAERLIAGEPVYAILRDWHERDVTSPRGKRWHSTSFRHVMTSARIAGLRVYRGEVVGEATWEPIIDRATWEAVKAVFADPERRRRQGSPRKYLLTGLGLHCGREGCGAPLIARPAVKADGRSVRQYVCSPPPRGRGCGKITQIAEPLELYVTERLLDWLAGPGLAELLAAADSDDTSYAELAAERAATERTLDQLADWLTDGTLDQPRYLRQKARILEQLAALDRRLARRPVAPILAEISQVDTDLRAWWDAATIERRRSLVAATIEEITVGPARRTGGGFDHQRVKVRFRGRPS
jgi:DNA invertase Pin-like site-specific DNA recombinase